MALRTLTAADAIIMLAFTGLFPTPQQLQGFAADDVFDTEDVEPVEISTGVDGRMSAGWVPQPVPWSITLQADSPSNDMFETVYAQQQALRTLFYANGTVLLPATGRLYTLTKGVIQTLRIMPGAKKTLQPRKYNMRFESIIPSNA